MRRIDHVEPKFVEEIPREPTPGKLYISITYATATHLCCCGCGREVVTPLHPTRWALTYDGETASLDPSVGSWSLPCQSHYVIRKNRILWAAQWSKDKIEAARQHDRRATAEYFWPPGDATEASTDADTGAGSRTRRLWRRLRGSRSP